MTLVWSTPRHCPRTGLWIVYSHVEGQSYAKRSRAEALELCRLWPDGRVGL